MRPFVVWLIAIVVVAIIGAVFGALSPLPPWAGRLFGSFVLFLFFVAMALFSVDRASQGYALTKEGGMKAVIGWALLMSSIAFFLFGIWLCYITILPEP